MVRAFQNLGVDFGTDRIQKIRTDESSLAFGVPKGALDAHSFHMFRLTNHDGSARFRLRHEIEGLTPNAEVTLEAVRFLSRHKAAGGARRVFCISDLLTR